jgi:hypothetical protein
LQATDYGKPVSGLNPIIEVWQDDAFTGEKLFLRNDLRSPSGILVNEELDQYLALFRPERAGVYRLLAKVNFKGKDVKRPHQAETQIRVTPAVPPSERVLGIDFESSGSGCLMGAKFSLDWISPAPGLYVFSIYLPLPDGKELEVSASHRVTHAGKIRLEARIPRKMVHQLGTEPIKHANRVKVLRFDSDQIQVVASLINPVLSQVLLADRFCL